MSATIGVAPSRARRLSGLLAVVSGKVFAQGSLLACNIIVARVAGLGEFGLYAAALNMVLMLDACAGSPLDYTAIRFSALHGAGGARTAQVQALALRAKLVLAALLGLLAWQAGPFLASVLLHDRARAPLLAIVALATTTLLLFRGLATFLQSQARFRTFAVLDGASGVLRIVAVGAAALLGFTGAGDYLAAIAAVNAVIIVVSVFALPQPYLTAKLPGREDRAAVVRFLGATTGSIILGTISGRADILFLAGAVPPEVLSGYAAAIQLASVATLLAGYASITTQPFLIPAIREGRANRLLGESLVVGAALGVLFALGAYVSGDALLSLLFRLPAGQSASSGLLPILAAGTAVDLVCMPVAMTYVLQVRPRAALGAELVMTAIFLAAASLVVHRHGAGTAETMAWLMTGFRVAKALVYIGLMASDTKRASVHHR